MALAWVGSSRLSKKSLTGESPLEVVKNLTVQAIGFSVSFFELVAGMGREEGLEAGKTGESAVGEFWIVMDEEF